MATPGNQLSSKPRCPPGPCIGTGLVRYSIRAKELYPANIHILEKLAARTSPLLDQASQHPVGKFLLTQSRLKLVLHFAFFTTFSILGAVLIWPTFGGDYPPGVDTATFLHLSWVTKLAASGDLSNPFQDPYWYGGFPYLQAYPPLGYGLVGVISFITKIDLVNVYVALLVMAYGGLGLVTYWLAAEQGLSRWASALAAVLTMLAYPVLSSINLVGLVYLLDVTAFRAHRVPPVATIVKDRQLEAICMGRHIHGRQHHDSPHDRYLGGIGDGRLVPISILLPARTLSNSYWPTAACFSL